MNPDTKQDKPPDIIFQEYSKDVVSLVNGYGTIFHSVKATCQDTRNAAIEHQFGEDEGINLHVNPIPLRAAIKNHLTNSPQLNDADYTFGLVSMEPPKFINCEELPSLEFKKRFRIDWGKEFGNIKDIFYVWNWTNRAMFPIPNVLKQHRSLLKVVYPTKKLTFRLNQLRQAIAL